MCFCPRRFLSHLGLGEPEAAIEMVSKDAGYSSEMESSSETCMGKLLETAAYVFSIPTNGHEGRSCRLLTAMAVADQCFQRISCNLILNISAKTRPAPDGLYLYILGLRGRGSHLQYLGQEIVEAQARRVKRNGKTLC